MTDHPFMERQPSTDITKHLETLKTRLGFAKFKLRNGWEKNTLLDVESFWRERQRQVLENLPTPRFKQRDILDNRTLHPHYHYHKNGLLSSPTFTHRQHQRRHSHQERKKKKMNSRLTRSHSTPTTSDSPPPPPSPSSSSQQQQQQAYDLSSTSSTCSNTLSPPPSQSSTYINKNDKKSHSSGEYEYDDMYMDDIGDDTEDDDCHYTYSLSKRQRTITPPSPPFNTDDPHHQKQAIIIQPKHNKNSLDYLSYAIAMTENQSIPMKQHQKQGALFQEKADCGRSDDDGDFHDALSTPFMTPPSPVTAAAEAMMMFGHHSH